MKKLQSLKNDIKLYLELEKTMNAEFWQCMMVVCEDELERLASEKDAEGKWKGQDSLHPSVRSDLDKLLEGKTNEQLEILRLSVIAKLDDPSTLDIEYWETLLRKISVSKAKVSHFQKLFDLLSSYHLVSQSPGTPQRNARRDSTREAKAAEGKAKRRG